VAGGHHVVSGERRVIVVGAGSAGCVVAARLSEDPTTQVLLLEAGPDRTLGDRPPSLTTLDWVQAFGEDDAWWRDSVATRVCGGEAHPYPRGRGVGGSAQVNGLVSAAGPPTVYDRWAADLGCVGWSWREVAPTFRDLQARLWRVPTEALAPLDVALLRAAAALDVGPDIDPFVGEDGAGAAWLSSDGRSRVSSAEGWLDPARGRPNLRVRSAEVVRLLLERRTARGVELVGGSQLEADEVVLCAGALHSPAILLRSGVDRPGVGRNLGEHPSVSVLLRPRVVDWGQPHVVGARPPTGAVLRAASG
jgi:choline dehydrogenase-like flavoprotein